MVKRVFADLCGRTPDETERDTIQRLAKGFEDGGYKIRALFEETAITPGCVWDKSEE